MLESWLVPWLAGIKLLPGVLGMALEPAGASLGLLVHLSAWGSLELLCLLGKGRSSSRLGARGEAWLDVKPWQGSPRVSSAQGCSRSVSWGAQSCCLSAQPGPVAAGIPAGLCCCG